MGRHIAFDIVGLGCQSWQARLGLAGDLEAIVGYAGSVVAGKCAVDPGCRGETFQSYANVLAHPGTVR
jgi:hypothetical protein